MQIDKALEGDLDDILKLQKLCYQQEAEIYSDFNIEPLLQTNEALEKEFLNKIILKTVIQSKIIGSIRAFKKNKTVFIGKVIVHPEYQNKGIGKKLIIEIEKIFKNTKRFELFTGFKSEKNLYLYQKLGYSPFKKEKVSNNVTLIFLEKLKSNK